MNKLLVLAITLLFTSQVAAICSQVDEHQILTLQCTNGQVITGITYASYGTPTGGCAAPCNSACHATTSQAKVEQVCLHQPSCQIAASNGVFGDPCIGTFKRLLVQATCGNPPAVNYQNTCNSGDNQKVLEHQSLTVGCATGTISAVLFASYGKPTGIAAYGYNQGWCHATTSKSVVEAACLGQTSCTIAAENSVFTDPCVGTFKDLAVTVQCSCPPTYSCTDTSYQAWSASQVNYPEGYKVQFGGVLYEAKISIQADCAIPVSNTTVWRQVYTCPYDCSTLNNWQQTQSYTGGKKVVYSGWAWKAAWWSQGAIPENKPYDEWIRLGKCSGSERLTVDCDPYLNWVANQIYASAGHRVRRAGKLYQNKWWVQGEDPALESSWTLVATCQTPYTPERVDCSGAPVWDNDAVYQHHAQVRKGGKLYRARWWTCGEDPVLDGGVWELMDLCL